MTTTYNNNINNHMKDNSAEQINANNNNSSRSASQVQKPALFPFTSPPPLPGLPDPFASDNTMTSNNTNHINDKTTFIAPNASDSDKEAKVVEVQSKYKPSFNMNLFINDRANASKAQPHVATL